jgi:hypothetical protein
MLRHVHLRAYPDSSRRQGGNAHDFFVRGHVPLVARLVSWIACICASIPDLVYGRGRTHTTCRGHAPRATRLVSWVVCSHLVYTMACILGRVHMCANRGSSHIVILIINLVAYTQMLLSAFT